MNLVGEILISIFTVFVIRKLLETSLRIPRWDWFFSKFWLISLVLYFASLAPFFDIIEKMYPLFAYCSILTSLILLRNYRPSLFDSSKSIASDKVYAIRNYYPARPFLIAFIPVGLVFLMAEGTRVFWPELYKLEAETFGTLRVFSYLWLVGFGIFAAHQTKKEKKVTEKLQSDAIEADIQKQKLEKLVIERTQQLQLQNKKLESALFELKATQAQLIQSKKMASLGELTAGIAHEIQNPLNFVNNFSEVSNELISEIKEERSKSQEARDETLIGEILGDIEQNLQKINHHGKRADAIVKGMLEHSKRGSGQKELTDLNALADDFLRLSYQSFLAKDPNFKVELKTNLDSDLPKISVIPQDIGKVLLNLYSNAFYACAERSRSAVNERSKTDPDFQPLVQLTTRNLGGKIEVGVKDNGPGIPDSIKDKIFQPFFTTKPTGSGTGLGLSLSYDIVKAHGGELKVNSNFGEGIEFLVFLPYLQNNQQFNSEE